MEKNITEQRAQRDEEDAGGSCGCAEEEEAEYKREEVAVYVD